MTPREELIGAWTALDVTVAHMHEFIVDARRVMGSIPYTEPNTREERATITQSARSLSLRARTAIAWGADDDTCAELTDECSALIREAAAIYEQHRRSVFVRFAGLRLVAEGETT